MNQLNDGRVWEMREGQWTRNRTRPYLYVFKAKRRVPTLWYYFIPLLAAQTLMIPGWTVAYAWVTIFVSIMTFIAVALYVSATSHMIEPYGLKWMRGLERCWDSSDWPGVFSRCDDREEYAGIISYWLNNEDRITEREINHLYDEANKIDSLIREVKMEEARIAEKNLDLPDLHSALASYRDALKEL